MLPIDPAPVLQLLTATPRRIARATKGLTNERLKRKPAPDAWSASEVLAHVRACADVWGSSMMTILAQDRPTLRYVSPRTWIRKTNYTGLEFAASFRAYSNQRKDLVKALRPLPLEAWSRSAMIQASTKPRLETVFTYAQRMAQHEAGHCDQIERILAATSPKQEPREHIHDTGSRPKPSHASHRI
jgi:hypothetical protein